MRMYSTVQDCTWVQLYTRLRGRSVVCTVLYLLYRRHHLLTKYVYQSHGLVVLNATTHGICDPRPFTAERLLLLRVPVSITITNRHPRRPDNTVLDDPWHPRELQHSTVRTVPRNALAAVLRMGPRHSNRVSKPPLLALTIILEPCTVR